MILPIFILVCFVALTKPDVFVGDDILDNLNLKTVKVNDRGTLRVLKRVYTSNRRVNSPVNQCSRRNSRRIYGGDRAETAEFPYQACLAVKVDNDYNLLCGGAILDENHIITAGHCIRNVKMWVKVGSKDIQSKRGTWHLVVRHRTLFNNDENDIALLRVMPKIEMNQYTQPVVLGESYIYPPPGSPVWITGWGLMECDSSSNTLRKLKMRLISTRNCSKHWENVIRFSKMQICAEVENNKSTCTGDSGGPLVFMDKSLGPVLIGVLSFGDEDCGTGQPEVYTRVDYYYRWIHTTIREFNIEFLNPEEEEKAVSSDYSKF